MRNGDSSAKGNLVPNVSSSTAVVQMLGVNQGMQELRNRFLDEWIHFINGEISKKIITCMQYRLVEHLMLTKKKS